MLSSDYTFNYRCRTSQQSTNQVHQTRVNLILKDPGSAHKHPHSIARGMNGSAGVFSGGTPCDLDLPWQKVRQVRHSRASAVFVMALPVEGGGPLSWGLLAKAPRHVPPLPGIVSRALYLPELIHPSHILASMVP